MGVTNKSPEFLKMNPMGKVCFCFFFNLKATIFYDYLCVQTVYQIQICKHFIIFIQIPVLETPEGPVCESNAIARYGKTVQIPF